MGGGDGDEEKPAAGGADAGPPAPEPDAGEETFDF
jgi:hypothetical protein